MKQQNRYFVIMFGNSEQFDQLYVSSQNGIAHYITEKFVKEQIIIFSISSLRNDFSVDLLLIYLQCRNFYLKK